MESTIDVICKYKWPKGKRHTFLTTLTHTAFPANIRTFLPQWDIGIEQVTTLNHYGNDVTRVDLELW